MRFGPFARERPKQKRAGRHRVELTELQVKGVFGDLLAVERRGECWV